MSGGSPRRGRASATPSRGSRQRGSRRRRPPSRDRGRRIWLWSSVGGGAVVLIALIAVALRAGQAAPAAQETRGTAPRVTIASTAGGGAEVGGQAPSLTAATVSGSTFRLPAGKPAVVYFMAGWCSSCVPESEALARIDRQEHARLAILAVDADPTDPLSSLQNFIHRVGDPGYAFAQDEGGKLVGAFAARSLDTTVVLNASGRIVDRSAAPLDEQTLRAALAAAGLR